MSDPQRAGKDERLVEPEPEPAPAPAPEPAAVVAKTALIVQQVKKAREEQAKAEPQGKGKEKRIGREVMQQRISGTQTTIQVTTKVSDEAMSLALSLMVGDVQKVKGLLETSTEHINHGFTDGATLLMSAVQHAPKATEHGGDGIGCIELLLDYGANVNSVDKQGKTALHVAIEMQMNDVIDRLLACGAVPKRCTTGARGACKLCKAYVRRKKKLIADRPPGLVREGHSKQGSKEATTTPSDYLVPDDPDNIVPPSSKPNSFAEVLQDEFGDGDFLAELARAKEDISQKK